MDPLAWPCPVWQSLSTLTQFVDLSAMDSWHKQSFTKKFTAACSITSFFYTEHDVVLVIPSYSACSDHRIVLQLKTSPLTFSPSSVPFVIGIFVTFLWYFMQTPHLATSNLRSQHKLENESIDLLGQLLHGVVFGVRPAAQLFTDGRSPSTNQPPHLKPGRSTSPRSVQSSPAVSKPHFWTANLF